MFCPDADVTDPDSDGVCSVDHTWVALGTAMRYVGNLTDPGVGQAWTSLGFDASSWPSGLYGAGYDASGSVSGLIFSEVAAGSYSIYTRAIVSVSSPGSYTQLRVGADYDDGYVVWLNGVEIHRSPEIPPGPPGWDTDAAAEHESSNGPEPDYGLQVDVSSVALPLLVDGPNLLAVGVWNRSAQTSTGLVIVPWVSATQIDNCPATPNADQTDTDGDGVGDACE